MTRLMLALVLLALTAACVERVEPKPDAAPLVGSEPDGPRCFPECPDGGVPPVDAGPD